jgi:hypothetical protein
MLLRQCLQELRAKNGEWDVPPVQPGTVNARSAFERRRPAPSERSAVPTQLPIPFR